MMKWLLIGVLGLGLNGCGKWTAYSLPPGLPDNRLMTSVKRFPKSYKKDFEGDLRQCEANRARDRTLVAPELDRFADLQKWVERSASPKPEK